MPLSDLKCKSAKPKAKTDKLSDADGLQLWVRPTGVKTWYFAYRWKGSQTGFTLGKYPDVGLAEARDRTADARRLIRDGINPRDRRRNSRVRLTGEVTFGSLADDYYAKQEKEGRAAATLKKQAWHINLAKARFGTRLPDDVTTPDVLSLARTFESREQYETANRLVRTIAAVFRHGRAAGLCKTNPALDLRGALASKKATPRAAITDPKKVGPLLRAIDCYHGAPVVLAALQILPYVFTRPGELRQARWHEIDWQARVWTVPAERTKMRKQLKVPLAAQVIDILRRVQAMELSPDLVFPSPRKNRKPISDGTLNAALATLYDKEDVTPHGFRSTASTLLNASGRWHEDAIELQLGHVKAGVRGIYNRGDCWDQRVEMMAWWADYLDGLKATATVLRLVG
jgi:integrase